jgi:hypothetical protein
MGPASPIGSGESTKPSHCGLRIAPNVRNRALIEFESASMKGASDEGFRHGAGDENRTRMTSLEDESRQALARSFPYIQRKRLTMINRE